MMDISDEEKHQAKMSFIGVYFDDLDAKINYLDELYETGHRDEARVLCSCYIDWFASALYWPWSEKKNNFYFVKILKEHGGDEIFLRIHPQMLEDALREKANGPKWTAICNKTSAALQHARGRLYNEQEIIDLLSSLLNNTEIDDVKKELWRGTFAAIVYLKIRIPSVHGLGTPDEIFFDNTIYQDKQIPSIDFLMLYPCLKRIVVVARERSLSTAKFFGHDYKQADIT